jgi:hypothetical protein
VKRLTKAIDEIVESRDLNRITPLTKRPFILADGYQMGSNPGWVKAQASQAERDGAAWDAVTCKHGTNEWSRWSEIPNADYVRRLLTTAVDHGHVTITES